MGEERHARRLVKAIDTNVLVRFVARDDPHQAIVAEQTLADGAFIPLTVLLETAWVLRANYRRSPPDVADALSVILALPGIVVPEPAMVRWAIARSAKGADIVDMMHIAASRHQDAFATFDRGVARAAGPDSPVPVETLG
jgi:predicted nucleic-acid-binding protein